ncbi:hypothetical protein [Mycobacterium talmoniae]|uniref:Uncharacterized protein n=1 Tax=Mycobacterium talmoniae TaxID=1858794 RepID=A0A1S1NAU4_9MYCO|nr:hypothetical protein [Mycobacterium talmoniae]OHV00142.1 hypothetical protein BKN37_18470 [Mycobacterium talmoniae]
MTSFEMPDPGAGPRILADMLADAAGHQGPAALADPNTPDPKHDPKSKDQDGAEHNDTPGNDQKQDSPGEDNAKGHNADTDTTADQDEDDTYTTTEPGFPIGQLISGLIAAGIGTATAGASAAMAVPTAAMGTVMPLLNSLLTLVGTPGAGAPTGLGSHALAPPLGHVTAPDTYNGPSAQKYHDRAEHENAEEKPFPDQDNKASDTVDEARDTNAHANAAVTKSDADLRVAVAMAPATGPAVFAASARDAIVNARNAVSAAADHHQMLAARLATNRPGPTR